MARPSKTSFTEIKDLFVGIKDLNKKILEVNNRELDPGGIYSIYSEKTKFGMGKSQFAHFLKSEFAKKSKSIFTKYHYLSPSEEGFKILENELRESLINCDNEHPFYLFIDEIDLISEPNINEREIVKRMERLGNTLIEVAEKAYNEDLPFYIFLVLSKRIQDDIEKLVSHRITRRITPLMAVDILFTKEDIESLATRFFSMLWVLNYKNIQDKFVTFDYRFKEIIGNMITDFINNLDYLGLNIESSVIGDFIEKFMRIFDIVMDGVSENDIKNANLTNESDVGTRIEILIKDYLISRNKPLIYKEKEHQIKVIYVKDKKQIGKHETDGYYSFFVGDTQIDIMPVEITVQKNLRGHKKNQLKEFLENRNTLLIWIFSEPNKVKEELEYVENKILKSVNHQLYELLLPRDFVKYTLILKERTFSFLEELKKDMMNIIQTFLTKHAKILFNQWMMEKPIPVDDQDGKKVEFTFNEVKDKVEKLFENLFEVFNNTSKKAHGTLKKILKEQIEYLNKGLKLDDDFLDIENIYRETIELLQKENLGRYNEPYSDRTLLMKEEGFTVKKAVNLCTPIVTSRIETILK